MGSGVMGGGITQTFAQFGYKVIVRDLSDEIESRETIENGRFGIRTAVSRGLMGQRASRRSPSIASNTQVERKTCEMWTC
jgi:3-hydroxyacyl-CoA dehydrogenase